MSRLSSIEQQTGVPESIMVAIWGHETNYGSYTGNFDLIRSLASLAYEGRRRALFEGERRALAAARGVIVTSPATARALADFDVAAARIAVVEPGTAPAALAPGSGLAGLTLLCVATVTPRKGHALLVEALAGLQDRPWTLLCAGSLTMDAACSAALAAAIARALLPVSVSTSALGPMKVIPAAAHASARAGFSDRKP